MILGLFFAILTGLSWVIVGAVVGLAERRGFGSSLQQAVSAAMIALLSLAMLGVGRLVAPGSPDFSLVCDLRSALWTLACGFFNYLMIVCMGRAMAKGPNGMVWTIVQSGVVFPFTMGVALGSTVLTVPRAAGVACVLAGVAFVGSGKGGASEGQSAAGGSGGWRAAALLGFVLCGVTQCSQCLAAMGPEETRPTALIRIFLTMVGTGIAYGLHRALQAKAVAGAQPSQVGIGSATVAKRASVREVVVVCALYSVTFFLSCLLFLFNALDRLEAAGMIALANPAMLAACLVGFAIYGAAVLRERPNLRQLVGMAFALLGIALVSWPQTT